MINIVTIDPSLTSTAMTVNGKPFSIASENIALTKTAKLSKWFELSSEHCEIITVNTEYSGETKYSKLEVNKLQTFQKIANIVRKTIDNHVNPEYNTVCLIEGYSYSSMAGPLIDLVTLGSLIRERLFSRNNTELVVLSPSTVKKLSARLTYQPIAKGKKVEYRNNEGIAGGSFKKHEIYKVLIENASLETDWIRFLRSNQDLLRQKSIPKPIEDINDAVVMYHICQKEFEDLQDFNKTVEFLKEY